MTDLRVEPRRRQIRLALAGLGLAAAGRFLAEFPGVVEWHRTVLFPRLAAVLQSVSGGTSGTVGELFAMALMAAAAALIIGRRSRVAGSLLFVLGFLVFGFYLSWGFAYRYPPLSARLSSLPESDEKTSAGLLADLGERAAALAARAAGGAVSLAGTDAEFLARVNAGLDAGFARWPASVEAAPVRGVGFGPAKASRVSFALTRLQISGYYFPWTGEAQIDAEMPRTLWPRVSGHEKAHQRGFARENEATIIGTITCLSSPDPTVFYGGALGLFVAFDRELARVDPDARRRIWALLPPRATEDLRAEAAFWKRHEGVAGEVSEKVNDTYLKAQGVRSGVASYAETTRLFVQAIETPGLDLGRLLRGQGPGAGSPEQGSTR